MQKDVNGVVDSFINLPRGFRESYFDELIPCIAYRTCSECRIYFYSHITGR